MPAAKLESMIANLIWTGDEANAWLQFTKDNMKSFNFESHAGAARGLHTNFLASWLGAQASVIVSVKQFLLQSFSGQ
jgi:hypothetical protein